MSPQEQWADKERLTTFVYGETFALYDEQAFDEFLLPLYRRLHANGIDRGVFAGKRCLDAGCGGGRASILMAQCGAGEVVATDLSERNIEAVRYWAARKGLNNIAAEQATLMQLPFGDESFDIVWCNGVLHHCADPDRGLCEVSRVLKCGGHLWLYLYGAGGIYWRVIDWIRHMLRGMDPRRCILQLRLMATPVRRIAEWMDDWFVPYLRRYTADDVIRRLSELGYENPEVLSLGMHYDTSQRKAGGSEKDANLMGEGDLRFFCTKLGPSLGDASRLPDPPDGRGSPYEEDDKVRQVDAPLARIEAGLDTLAAKGDSDADFCRILACRSAHMKVRDMLECDGPLDLPAFIAYLTGLAELIEALAEVEAA